MRTHSGSVVGFLPPVDQCYVLGVSLRAVSVDDGEARRIQETLDWVAPHCDLLERIDRIPPSAQVRGVWTKILERQLQERGLLPEYRRLLPGHSSGAFELHHVSDLLLRAAVAGALLAGPEDLHQGMFEITRDNARRFTSSLMGRTLLRLLARDPRRLCQQILASRRQTCHYGSWELLSVREGEARIYLREEYIWIESYLLGAAVGTFEVLGDDVEATAELEGPFHGTHIIRWSPR